MTSQRLDFDKRSIPVIFSININGVRYKVKITYNKRSDSLYFALLDSDGTQLQSEKIILGQPLFTSWVSADKPNATISAFDLTQKEERVTYANLNESVFLYITPKSDLVTE
jgi:hypothetical protein